MPNSVTQQRLLLGDVNFFKFEVPEEIPNLFGVQKMAIHDFAGGSRTVQQLGAFPFPEIEWRGVFFNGDAIGSTAVQRASQLNTYRVQAQPISLVWGPFQYDVIVCEFEVIAKLAQELQYRIKLIPIQDNTTTSSVAASPPNATQSLFDANMGVTNATLSRTGILLPSVLLFAAANITQAVNTAVTQANGSAQNIPSTTQASIQAQITALQTALQPYINGSNYGQSTGATTLSTSLYTLSTTLGIKQIVPIATIAATNPNLPLLASQYYGNDALWPLIAQYNNLQDMFPIGTFTLVIPPTTIQSSFIPS